MCDEVREELDVAREAQKAIDRAWKMFGISWKISLAVFVVFPVASFYVAQIFFDATLNRAVQVGASVALFFVLCESVVLIVCLKRILSALTIKIAYEEGLGKRKSELEREFEALVIALKRCVKLCVLFFGLVFGVALLSGAKLEEAFYAGSSVIIVFVLIMAMLVAPFYIRLQKD
jgi:hypothetical protein